VAPRRPAPAGSPRRRTLAALALPLLAGGCLHGHPAPAPAAPAGAGGGARAEVGLASWYADRFHGRPTASGQPYDEAALTCAHRTAPFGTRLRVTDLDGGRSVVVTVNDRGPHVAGRVVDLSRAAAERLDMLGRGLVRVRVERVAGPGG
jgi:rare lipoprotein A